ncbi:PREDICTED: interleukin-8-like [Nanorana parkeri]|uniref:interleukin-8-like n=1 Tax=Nanorana parkeri TaxID=125878 RepID=UPI0008544F5A|nr:PREDICTED: interleukin-8-like [Nanorana parkeri]
MPLQEQGRTLISAQELRCQCVKTESKPISHRHFLNLEVIPKGPHCKHVEVIATMKRGLQVCLEPTAPWVIRIIERFLNTHPSPNTGFDPSVTSFSPQTS